MIDTTLLNQIINLQLKKDINIGCINLIATRYCNECIEACEKAGIKKAVFISFDLNFSSIFKNAVCNRMKKLGYTKIELKEKAIFFSK
jgi:hypothetical protein